MHGTKSTEAKWLWVRSGRLSLYNLYIYVHAAEQKERIVSAGYFCDGAGNAVVGNYLTKYSQVHYAWAELESKMPLFLYIYSLLYFTLSHYFHPPFYNLSMSMSSLGLKLNFHNDWLKYERSNNFLKFFFKYIFYVHREN